ncbi:MAG: LON peptidase substrate-binding domain-containing protein [Alphaproteobacteria bacterium]
MAKPKPRYAALSELPTRVPVFPLNALLLPGTELPLNIFEPRYLAMIDEALGGDRFIALAQPLSDKKTGDEDLLEKIGCLGRITSFEEVGRARYTISLSGVARLTLVERCPSEALFQEWRVDYDGFAGDLTPQIGEDTVDRNALLKTFAAYLRDRDLEVDWSLVAATPSGVLINNLSVIGPFGARERQALLEAPDLAARAEILVALAEFALAQNAAGAETSLQ